MTNCPWNWANKPNNTTWTVSWIPISEENLSPSHKLELQFWMKMIWIGTMWSPAKWKKYTVQPKCQITKTSLKKYHWSRRSPWSWANLVIRMNWNTIGPNIENPQAQSLKITHEIAFWSFWPFWLYWSFETFLVTLVIFGHYGHFIFHDHFKVILVILDFFW